VSALKPGAGVVTTRGRVHYPPRRARWAAPRDERAPMLDAV